MDYGIEILKVLLALIIIIGIFGLIVKLLKARLSNFKGNGQMKILGRCYLSSDKVLYLVQVIDEAWLISTTKDRMEFIEKIDLAKIEVKEEFNLLNLFNKDESNEE